MMTNADLAAALLRELAERLRELEERLRDIGARPSAHFVTDVERHRFEYCQGCGARMDGDAE